MQHIRFRPLVSETALQVIELAKGNGYPLRCIVEPSQTPDAAARDALAMAMLGRGDARWRGPSQSLPLSRRCSVPTL